MKKRIGSKLYDSDKGICLLPEQNLYKQPNKKTFYLYNGEKITPIDYDEAFDMVKKSGRDDLLSMFGYKANPKGLTCVNIDTNHAQKLAEYARKQGVTIKSIIENYIDSLSME